MEDNSQGNGDLADPSALKAEINRLQIIQSELIDVNKLIGDDPKIKGTTKSRRKSKASAGTEQSPMKPKTKKSALVVDEASSDIFNLEKKVNNQTDRGLENENSVLLKIQNGIGGLFGASE